MRFGGGSKDRITAVRQQALIPNWWIFADRRGCLLHTSSGLHEGLADIFRHQGAVPVDIWGAGHSEIMREIKEGKNAES